MAAYSIYVTNSAKAVERAITITTAMHQQFRFRTSSASSLWELPWRSSWSVMHIIVRAHLHTYVNTYTHVHCVAMYVRLCERLLCKYICMNDACEMHCLARPREDTWTRRYSLPFVEILFPLFRDILSPRFTETIRYMKDDRILYHDSSFPFWRYRLCIILQLCEIYISIDIINFT